MPNDCNLTACHGWLWRPHADYGSAEAEATDLDRDLDNALHAKQLCITNENLFHKHPYSGL